MRTRHRLAAVNPAAANGRTVALPYPSILILLVIVTGAIPALAADGGPRAASQVLFIAELALLLVVGIADTRDPHGGFSKDLSMLTQGFDGPLVVVDNRGGKRHPATRRYGRILMAVTGTDVSRRGVEIGLNLARATDAQVTALYVTRANSDNSRQTLSRRQVTRRNELAVLRDIAALAERYEVALRSTTRADMAPDQAILREAARGYDLVVLGVSRRAGDVLFFGDTAAAVLERSPTSNLFVAS
jgi:nucleotide-binding universal stress UspA family protein